MNTTIKKFLPYAFVGIISGATTIGAVKLVDDQKVFGDTEFFSSSKNAQFSGLNTASVSDDFVKAAGKAVPAVVTIKSFQNQRQRTMPEQDLFDFFFGPGMGSSPRNNQRMPDNMPTGMGSGVIISPDGYIISNNHVVAGASKLEVVLSNKKSYTATVVGTDPTTDIALLKIDETNLPYLSFANSDNVEVGQWVLAVGNPLGLNSTVTAGIISAKGRSINLLQRQSRTPIESFIQTDAAINRGNSGGALVNTNGDLIGINSAISSNTGYYEGYGFAVPSNLAKKVVEDMKKYGIVQRAFIGVTGVDLSNDMQVAQYNAENKTKLKSGSGVYVREAQKGGAADDAGIRTGDIIIRIDNQMINSFADLSLMVGSRRPGDKITVTYLRDGKEYNETVTLKDKNGKTSARTLDDLSVTEKIGAEFKPLSESFKVNFGLDYGVVAVNVQEGGEMDKIGIGEDFIIMEVNGKKVSSQDDVEKILKNYKGNVQIKFVDGSGRIYTKGFKMP